VPKTATRVTYAGTPLLAARGISWSLMGGTQPFTTAVDVHASAAQSMSEMVGRSASLTITSETADTRTIKDVFVVGETGSLQPFTRTFILADKRWKWNRTHVRRTYNDPKRTGNRRVVGDGPEEIAQVLDIYTYRKYSLDGESRKWTALRMIEDVLTRVVGAGGFTFDQRPSRDLPVERLDIDDPGDVAIGRALAHVPGFDVYVAHDGIVHVFDTLGLEAGETLLRTAGHAVVGEDVAKKSVLRDIRPSSVTVLFNREVELRFDSLTESSTVTVESGQLYCDNVMPSPDLTISGVPGFTGSVSRGTFVPIRDLITAWNNDRPSGTPAMTLDSIRRMWFVGLDQYAEHGKQVPDVNWVARVGALRAHFRQTYRISKDWMERIKSLRSYRVAVIDPVTGARAPAFVASDYCVEPTDKARIKAGKSSKDVFGWMNVQGWAESLSDAIQAPAVVQILDEDLGVFRVDYVPNLIGLTSTTHPSLVVNGQGDPGTPSHDFRQKKFSPTRDGRVKGTNSNVSLSPDHKVAVILTAGAGAPNNQRQLHPITVSPAEAYGAMGRNVEPCAGPEWQIRVGPAIYAARFAWMEDAGPEAVFKKMFGFGGGEGIDAGSIPQGLFQNKKECEALAKAAAASVYSFLGNRMEGSTTVHWRSMWNPAGNVGNVTYTINPEGGTHARLSAIPPARPPDLFGFLDDNTRSIILGLVQLKQAN
jgi:hypothetical protein